MHAEKNGSLQEMAEKILFVLFVIALSLFTGWIFYDSLWGILSGIVVIPAAYDSFRKYRGRKNKKIILKEFQSVLLSISASVSAGFSVEHAFLDAEKELYYLYGDQSKIADKIHRMTNKVNLNFPIETAFEEFAVQTEIEEIMLFSEVFIYAKRSGGDFIKMIDTSIRQIREQFETELEIETMISAKRMEQILMCVIPIALLMYLKVSTPEFLMVLYNNMLGTILMSFVLAGFLAAFKLAEKIVEIRV